MLLRKFNFSVDKTKEILNFKTEIRLLNLQTIDSALYKRKIQILLRSDIDEKEK